MWGKNNLNKDFLTCHMIISHIKVNGGTNTESILMSCVDHCVVKGK